MPLHYGVYMYLIGKVPATRATLTRTDPAFVRIFGQDQRLRGNSMHFVIDPPQGSVHLLSIQILQWLATVTTLTACGCLSAFREHEDDESDYIS